MRRFVVCLGLVGCAVDGSVSSTGLEAPEAPAPVDEEPPGPAVVAIDFELQTIESNPSGYHEGFSFMQEHVVADLELSTIADYRLWFRSDGKRHEPYQDNFCSVRAEPLPAQTLFTIVCSRQTSQSAGGYMLPTSATLIVRRVGEDHQLADFTFATSGTHTSGLHAGFTFLQEHVVVEVPFSRVGGYQLLVREDAATQQPFVDNYCGIAAEPLDDDTLFTVICKRSESESAGGYVMPTTGRIAIRLDESPTDYTVETIAPNTLAFHDGYDFMQSHVGLPASIDELSDVQLLVPGTGTSEPGQDHYCNLWVESLGDGSMVTAICSRRSSDSEGGFMLPATLRLAMGTLLEH